jgi:hypothetical protein
MPRRATAAIDSIEKPDRVIPVGLLNDSEFITSAKLEIPLESAAAILALGKAILAVDRTIAAWFERNFAFLFTV